MPILGSPCDSDYPVSFKTWENPHSGQVTDIADYFIPHDKTVAGIIDNVKTVTEEVVEDIKKERRWDRTIIPKSSCRFCDIHRGRQAARQKRRGGRF